uniref:Uncharacterized protein n=1 Tax=Clytia hemisphaerica TaxID=252671 RepID=A0A7M5V0P9_9CNID
MNEPLPRIKERRLIRERLKCRPFDWYLMEVYPELRVPNVDELAYGEIKQIYKGQSYCLSESKTSKVLAVKCIPNVKKMQWVMSVTGMIQNEKDKCLYASKKRKRISLKDCDNSDFNQLSPHTLLTHVYFAQESIFHIAIVCQPSKLQQGIILTI